LFVPKLPTTEISAAAGYDFQSSVIQPAAPVDFFVLAILSARTQHRGSLARSNPPTWGFGPADQSREQLQQYV
jgi:hypothetical protein